MKRVGRFARELAAAFLLVMQPPVPVRVARWVPQVMLAGPGERDAVDRAVTRLRS